VVDGTALSDAQWEDWAVRNRGLAALLGTRRRSPRSPATWRGRPSAFNASTNLRRANLFARLSWQQTNGSPPSTCSTRGRSRPHRDGRWAGKAIGAPSMPLRVYSGPSDALLARLPTRASASWPRLSF